MHTGRKRFIWPTLGLAALISMITRHALHNARGVMLEPARPKFTLDIYPTHPLQMSNDQMWSLVRTFFTSQTPVQTFQKIEPAQTHVMTESSGGGGFWAGAPNDSSPWYGFGYGPLTYYTDFGPGPHYAEWIQNPPENSTFKPQDLELFPPSNVGLSLASNNDEPLPAAGDTPPSRIPEPSSILMIGSFGLFCCVRRK